MLIYLQTRIRRLNTEGHQLKKYPKKCQLINDQRHVVVDLFLL